MSKNLQVKSLFFYNNVSFCINYKAASTYWLQVFRFLHGDVPTNVSRPSEIGKFETHLVPTKKIRRRQFFSTKDHSAILKSFRFMTTRDPYSRLWSVYIDKFILLDTFFWRKHAPGIRQYNSRVANASLEHVNSENTVNNKCNDITFTAFLNYVVKKGEKNAHNLDDHMRPIHYGCNPCFYKPDFICKVETMTNEKKHVLHKLGLENVDNIGDFNAYVLNEISMITDFEFRLWKSYNKKSDGCLTDVSLEKNMIRIFVTNGYLPEDVWNEFQGLLPLGEKLFKPRVNEIFLTSGRNASVVKEQKKKFRTDAYRGVPINILYKIRDLFKYDFDLFGYNSSPDYIFGSREASER